MISLHYNVITICLAWSSSISILEEKSNLGLTYLKWSFTIIPLEKLEWQVSGQVKNICWNKKVSYPLIEIFILSNWNACIIYNSKNMKKYYWHVFQKDNGVTYYMKHWIYKWTMARPYVMIELWPNNQSRKPSRNLWSGQPRMSRTLWLPASLFFCASFQLRINQRKPNKLPNQTHNASS